MPAAVLWDMDGTLVDTEPYWFEAERDLVESFGGTWPDEHAKAVVGFDLLDSAAYIQEHGHVPLDAHTIVERLLDGVVARLEQHIPWRPGACRLLADLNRAGVPCALVTMSWHRFVDPVVAALPPGSFVAVITGDEVPHGAGKPGPLPYQMGAEACGVDPVDCVAIEDSPTGVRSALAAGCRVLGVPNVRRLDRAPGLRRVESLRSITIDDLAALPHHTSGQTGRVRRHTFGLNEGATRVGMAAVAAAVLVVAVWIGTRGRGEADALPPGAVPVDVWAPYWTLADTVPQLEARVGQIRDVSPFWFGARSATEIVVDESADPVATKQFLAVLSDRHGRLVPSIRDEMAAGAMAAVLADPAGRTRHVATIAAFAEQLGADGIDLDYEQFAFADGAATWATTRPNWVAFVAELATALHEQGRTLTVSVPPVYVDASGGGDRGYWVYDHGAIAEHVDAIRIMAYDYSVAEPGPIAPLDWVASAVAGVSAAVPAEQHHKLVLGVPAYGNNWVTATSGVCPVNAEGRATVTARTVADLIARRTPAPPAYDPAIAEWSFTYDLPVSDGTTACTQTRVVRWVDAEGVAARVDLARRAGWGGVALWAFGYDDDQVWSSLLSAARRPLPAAIGT
jgi:beta-phosphoglucomutase-like phosphatase (HAD superfamily)/spore germination protein YaaH